MPNLVTSSTMWNVVNRSIACCSVWSIGITILHSFTSETGWFVSKCSYSFCVLTVLKLMVWSLIRCSAATTLVIKAALLYLIMCRSVSQNKSLGNCVSTSSLITRSMRLKSMLLRPCSVCASPSQSCVLMRDITFSVWSWL